jgi:hypothetical protein
MTIGLHRLGTLAAREIFVAQAADFKRLYLLFAHSNQCVLFQLIVDIQQETVYLSFTREHLILGDNNGLHESVSEIGQRTRD